MASRPRNRNKQTPDTVTIGVGAVSGGETIQLPTFACRGGLP